MPRETKQAKKERADRLINRYWAEGLEHGPIDYAEFGKLMETIPFDEVQAMFNARYPIWADELAFEVYGKCIED